MQNNLRNHLYPHEDSSTQRKNKIRERTSKKEQLDIFLCFISNSENTRIQMYGNFGTFELGAAQQHINLIDREHAASRSLLAKIDVDTAENGLPKDTYIPRTFHSFAGNFVYRPQLPPRSAWNFVYRSQLPIRSAGNFVYRSQLPPRSAGNFVYRSQLPPRSVTQDGYLSGLC